MQTSLIGCSLVTFTVLFWAVHGAAITPARAAGAEYIGTWGNDAAHCAIPQDQEGAPYVIAPGGYDQHEAHCTFKKITPKGGAWMIAAECSVEGDVQPQDFTLSVSGSASGGKLTWTDATGTSTMIRCK